MAENSSLTGSRADQDHLRTVQYRDSSKLAARANLHSKYGKAGVPWFQWIARNAAIPAGSTLLEVGCGAGWLWEQGARDFPSNLTITLTDLSEGMVAEALPRVRRHWPEAMGQIADATVLPFADHSFDAVLACHMLYHVPDPAAAVLEMRRVLKPGGVLAVTTNGTGNMAEFYLLRHAVFGGEVGDPSAASFSLDDAKKVMQEGFTEVELLALTGQLDVTDGEDLVAAMTSYPPADSATPTQLANLRRMIAGAFHAHGGIMPIPTSLGMVRARRAG